MYNEAAARVLLLLGGLVVASQAFRATAPVRRRFSSTSLDSASNDHWLGIDLSTQSVSVVILSDEEKIGPVDAVTVNFEKDLPHYKTSSGMHVSDHQAPGDNAVVTSPVSMWLDGLDMALSKLSASSSSLLTNIAGISASGQQHGTVYWKDEASYELQSMSAYDSKYTLNEVLMNSFARRNCPIWADSSTVDQCRRLEESFGGALALAKATGSAAYPRFSGIQMMKVFENEPEVWGNCEKVSLASSFIASVLIGSYAPMDRSDASGMNLMDIRTKEWNERVLEATEVDGIEQKLGPLVDSHEVIGTLNPFFSRKFGLPEGCPVVASSGDNPCSLAAMGLTGEDGEDVVVSLGTSDTAMGVTRGVPNPQVEGHVMVSPLNPDSYFMMLVYKNGGLMRESVRNSEANGSWGIFERILGETPPGNGGKMGLFLDFPEITPQVDRVGHFFAKVEGTDEITSMDESELSSAEKVRAAVESRFLSMRARLAKMGVRNPARVLAVGGASENRAMMQVLSDIFRAPVYTSSIPDAAAIGAAIRAKHGVLCKRSNSVLPFSSVVGSFEARGLEKVAEPHPEAAVLYEALVPCYMRLEETVKAME